MLRLSPEEEDELFRLFTAAYYDSGSKTTKEYKALQRNFREKVYELWNAHGRPFPDTLEDFRRPIVNQFLERGILAILVFRRLGFLVTIRVQESAGAKPKAAAALPEQRLPEMRFDQLSYRKIPIWENYRRIKFLTRYAKLLGQFFERIEDARSRCSDLQSPPQALCLLGQRLPGAVRDRAARLGRAGA